MSNALTTKFAKYFDEGSQTRGQDLVARGQARCVFAGFERLACEVMDGEELYAVQLQVANRELTPDCECPTFVDGTPCAHLWAALLLAEQNQDLGAAAKRGCKFRLPSKARDASDAVSSGDAVPEHHYDFDGQPRQRRRPEKLPASPRSESYLEYELPSRRPRKTDAPALMVDPAAPPILYVIRLESQPEDGDTLFLETWWRPEAASQGALPCRPFLPQPDSSVPTAADQDILTCLLECRTLSRPGQYRDPLPPHVFPIPGTRLAVQAELLATTGRVRWLSIKEKPARFHSLTFPLALKATFVVTITPTGPESYEAAAAWQTAEGIIPFEETQAIFAAGFAIINEQWRQVDFQNAFALASRFRQNPIKTMSTQAAKTFARQIALSTDLPTDAFPSAISSQRRLGEPVGRLYVRTAKFLHEGREQLHVELSFEYEDAVCSEHDVANRFPVIRQNLVVARDPEAEEALRERLRQLGFRWNARADAEEVGWKLHPSRLDAAVNALVMEGWHITAEGKTYRRPIVKPPTITSGLDWFDLQANVDYDGQTVPLPELLAAARNGANTVRLDDGTYGLLPQEWLEQYTALIEIGEVVSDKVRFRQNQAALIEAFLHDREAETDARFRSTVAALESFSGSTPVSAPPGFKASLRPYQEVGLGWLLAMRKLGLGACLADDMGLGKTVQILAYLAAIMPTAEKRPALIVMPKSLVFNWQSEIRKFTPWFKTHWHGGGGRRDPRKVARSCDIILTTYGTLRQDALQLAEIDFEVCILDESQAIKNRDSATARAARVLQARHRIVMTGTPVENHLGELFSQLDFLNPGLLGKLSAGTSSVAPTDAATLARLRSGVRPFILRRTKRDVAPELPPKTEQVIWCELEGAQRQAYDELKDYYRQTLLGEDNDDAGAKTSGSLDVLSALLRLRQAACHPALIRETYAQVPAAKLEVLRERLAAIGEEGHKALVFSQFTSLLKLVAGQLAADGVSFCYLDGATEDRGALVEAFQTDPALSVFLISLKAGGSGLNLTAADYVFLLDPWWNPAVEAQAIDRAYRIGQTLPVFAYKLIARDTVEEKVLAMQKRKRHLAASVLSKANAAPALSRDDLKFLLS
ncbi:MAG: DEAD/DEAH box helicase [Lentisphaerae bacterium]|jgi:hypothetical protein|nr:DEAD/DEAH box helicase [Lentisphaerota bacterium]